MATYSWENKAPSNHKTLEYSRQLPLPEAPAMELPNL